MRRLGTYRWALGRVLGVGLAVFALVGCSNLDPLGGEDFGGTTGPLDLADEVWDVVALKRLDAPASFIDPPFLDSEIPETVGIDYEGDRADRHRVMTDGFMRLEKGGTYVFNAAFATYIVTAGFDQGPSETCIANERGTFERGEVTVTLTPHGEAGSSNTPEAIPAVLDAEGDLRMASIPVTCSRTSGTSLITANILLEGVILRKR